MDYHRNYIEADPHILSKIENYIKDRLPKNGNSPATTLQKKGKAAVEGKVGPTNPGKHEEK